MSLINIEGLSQDDVIAQIVKAIQNSPDSEDKKNFIRDLAAKLEIPVTPGSGLSDSIPVEECSDYREKFDLQEYSAGHPNIQHRGKLVFIDDSDWAEDEANSVVFGDSCADTYFADGLSDVDTDDTDIDTLIDELDERAEKIRNVLGTLREIRDNGGKYVVWNNDDDFDYSEFESGDDFDD
jgi:hypothetical protein